MPTGQFKSIEKDWPGRESILKNDDSIFNIEGFLTLYPSGTSMTFRGNLFFLGCIFL